MCTRSHMHRSKSSRRLGLWTVGRRLSRCGSVIQSEKMHCFWRGTNNPPRNTTGHKKFCSPQEHACAGRRFRWSLPHSSRKPAACDTRCTSCTLHSIRGYSKQEGIQPCSQCTLSQVPPDGGINIGHSSSLAEAIALRLKFHLLKPTIWHINVHVHRPLWIWTLGNIGPGTSASRLITLHMFDVRYLWFINLEKFYKTATL